MLIKYLQISNCYDKIKTKLANANRAPPQQVGGKGKGTMAAIEKDTADKFIENLRGCNAVMRKRVSLSGLKPFKRLKLKREFNKFDNEAYEVAEKIEERSQRAICADDLMDLGAIVCRTTNDPQAAFTKVLVLLGIAVKGDK